MKNIVTAAAVLCTSLLVGQTLHAQTKIGCISISEVVGSMPESRAADSSLSDYRKALEQQYQAYQQEFTTLGASLSGPDTLKLTPAQRAVKRKSLNDMLVKLQGFNQEASEMMEQKKQSLLVPIQTKAENAIKDVAKENGYAYVFEKEVLHTFPSADDLLPLVRKKLGIKETTPPSGGGK